MLLARRQGLLGRRPARRQDALPRATRLLPSRPSTTKTASSPLMSGGFPSRRSTSPTAARTSRPRCDSSRRSTATRGTPRTSGRQLVICGDLNIARTERDVHPKERKPLAIGQLPEERALLERIIGRGLVDVGRARRSGQRRAVQLVGAVAQHARAQHRLAARLRAGQHRASPSGWSPARCRKRSAPAITPRSSRRSNSPLPRVASRPPVRSPTRDSPDVDRRAEIRRLERR